MSTYRLKNRVFNTSANCKWSTYKTTLMFDMEAITDKTDVEGLNNSGGSNTKITLYLAGDAPYCVADYYISFLSSVAPIFTVELHAYVSATTFNQFLEFKQDSQIAMCQFSVYDLLAASNYVFSKEGGEPEFSNSVPVGSFTLQIQDSTKSSIGTYGGSWPIAKKAYYATCLIIILLILILAKL